MENVCPRCGQPLIEGAEDERGVRILFCPNEDRIINVKDFAPPKPVTKKRTLDSILRK